MTNKILEQRIKAIELKKAKFIDKQNLIQEEIHRLNLQLAPLYEFMKKQEKIDAMQLELNNKINMRKENLQNEK